MQPDTTPTAPSVRPEPAQCATEDAGAPVPGLLAHAARVADEAGPGEVRGTIAALLNRLQRAEAEREDQESFKRFYYEEMVLALEEARAAQARTEAVSVALAQALRVALALRDAWRRDRSAWLTDIVHAEMVLGETMAERDTLREECARQSGAIGELTTERDTLRARVAALEADKEVARILNLSDEEVLDEVRAEGHDPEQVAAEMRALFERTLARLCDPWPAVRDAAGLGRER